MGPHPALARARGEYSLSLSFRWTAGTPLALKTVRLFEDDKELGSDPAAGTADSSLRPAVVTFAGAEAEARTRSTRCAPPQPAAPDSKGVVLSRAEATATFNKDEWAGIGGWGGKEIKAVAGDRRRLARTGIRRDEVPSHTRPGLRGVQVR